MKARIIRLAMPAVALVALTAGGLAAAAPASAVAEPTVTSVTPSSGPVAGGTQLVIIGTGFSTQSTMVSLGRFGVGGVACLNVVVVSSTRVTCTTSPWPLAAGPVGISITGLGGQAEVADVFTYTDSTPLPLTVKAASTTTKLPRAGSTVVITSATTSAQGRVHLKAVCTVGTTRVLGDQRLCSTTTGANGKLTVRTFGVRGVKVTVTAVAIPLAGQTGVVRSKGWVRTWSVS